MKKTKVPKDKVSNNSEVRIANLKFLTIETLEKTSIAMVKRIKRSIAENW